MSTPKRSPEKSKFIGGYISQDLYDRFEALGRTTGTSKQALLAELIERAVNEFRPERRKEIAKNGVPELEREERMYA